MKIQQFIKSLNDTELGKKGTHEFGKIKLRLDENIITYPDISKIKKSIKWKPKTHFLSGLDKTINFYKRYII